MLAGGNLDYRAQLRVQELLLQMLLECGVVGSQTLRLRLTALLSAGGGDETRERDGDLPHLSPRYCISNFVVLVRVATRRSTNCRQFITCLLLMRERICFV